MSAEPIIVTHYGIHWDKDNVAYLMQGRGGTNAIGLPSKSPFQVKLQGRSKICNHQIPLSVPVPDNVHWGFFLQLINDPLVQAMLPKPKSDGGVHFISQSLPNVVENAILLSKMSSPIYSVVAPMWARQPQNILAELDVTNVQPLVITDCAAKDSSTILQIAKVAVHKPRTLIFVGSDDVVTPPAVKRITSELGDQQRFDRTDLITLPWEQLGATAVRKYMRNEWPPQANPAQGSHDLHARTGRRNTAS